MSSRRRFLTLSAAAPLAAVAAAESASSGPCHERISLNGEWEFQRDGVAGWRTVTVPHTWQVEPENAEYMGRATYRRRFDVPKEWASSAVRVEFEAVFHTARVRVNGTPVGEHIGKGYTAFTLDLGPHLRYGQENEIVVEADNSFSETMLPRGRSSDWAHDGGIYRPVWLLVTPQVFVERVDVDADLDLLSRDAAVAATVVVRNTSGAPWEGRSAVRVVDEATGRVVVEGAGSLRVAAGERREVVVTLAMRRPKLWHFDHPHLYRLEAALPGGHSYETTFGVRKIETRDGSFFLNGERVRLMGVERMAGSHPEFGMAEPLGWIEHDHADMRALNCVYTRVHWPQDRRVLDWCDRHGMLMQTEVPTWGPETFKGMTDAPSEAILRNGLEQLREMIERDRNHPCLFSWGVSNEIGGQNPPAYAFVKRLYEEAKRLDPKRLVTYASNTLQKTPEKDVAGLMDYVMWNEYYESWYRGTPEDLARNLEEVHRAFPGKAIVISEYGYCACTADRPEGDGKRIDVLREHDAVFRARDYVAGLIFFDYNDYRTHIGDRGTGVMKQRVHGVVDVYGQRKPSWEALRRESSPVEELRVSGKPAELRVVFRTRRSVPSYTLDGYAVRAVAYGFGDIPVERVAVPLPRAVPPGAGAEIPVRFTQPAIERIVVEVVRPTGEPVLTETWRH